jgi:hypothetical protein
MGMMFLADQELSGRQPTTVVKEVEKFQDYGYYRDENGIKHFGLIPKNENRQLNIR